MIEMSTDLVRVAKRLSCKAMKKNLSNIIQIVSMYITCLASVSWFFFNIESNSTLRKTGLISEWLLDWNFKIPLFLSPKEDIKLLSISS